jgi:hypothetical protein
LMVGEVRDHASAELLIHAVQSGHQVFTTIHASSAIDIVARMRSNEVPDDVLGSPSFFSALMYQTLLPVLCQHCSIGVADFAKTVVIEQEFELLQRIFKYLKPVDAAKLRFKHDDGCPRCVAGVTGRSVASEVLLPDPYMLKCFRERRDADALLHYRHKNGKLSLEHGLSRALNGLFDLRDVEHKLDQITRLDELSYAVQVYKNPDSANTHVPYTICMTDLIDGDDLQDVAGEASKKQLFLAGFMAFLCNKDITVDTSLEPVALDKPAIVMPLGKEIESTIATVITDVVGDVCTEKTELTACGPVEVDTAHVIVLSDSKVGIPVEPLVPVVEKVAIIFDASVESILQSATESEIEVKAEHQPQIKAVVPEILAIQQGTVSLKETSQHPVKRIAELIQMAISDELSRNGLILSAKFLHARASDASLGSMIKNETLDKPLRDELQELTSMSSVMTELRGLDAEAFFSLLPKDKPASEAPVGRFKSKLLGGEDETDSVKKRTPAKVQTLESARNRRKGKPTDDPIGDNGKPDSTDTTE